MPARIDAVAIQALEPIGAARDLPQLERAFVSVVRRFVDCPRSGSRSSTERVAGPCR